MAEVLQARRRDVSSDTMTTASDSQVDDTNGGLPPLAYSFEDSDGWTTFPDPILYIYAGKGPYVGRWVVHCGLIGGGALLIFYSSDFMAFPVSLPDDGLIDVMAMPVVRSLISIQCPPLMFFCKSSRSDILSSLGGAAKGENYWHPKVWSLTL